MRTNRRVLLAGALAGAVAPRALFSADKFDVVVVGAGLAGLHAARLLEEQGASVVVLEAADRVGGRVQTLQSERGVIEVGAADLGALYARNRETAAQLGLELAPWPATPMGSWYHVQGQSFVLADWPELDINPLDEALRKIPPARLSGRFLPSPNPLKDLEAWLSPEFGDFDQPLGDLLRRNGAPEEAFKFMEVGHQFDSLNDVSALWRMREQMVLRLAFTAARERGEPARFIVKGGLGLLPDAMAGSLREEVRIGHRVSAIEQNQLGVTVTCANGARVNGGFVICAAPLTTVRNIEIEPALPPLVREAVDQIPYGRGTSVLLYINEPYWEVDGLPANFWTDLPIQRGFVNPAPAGEAFYLWMFSTGRADLAQREADDDAIARYVIEELNRIRPSTRGRLEPAAVRSWTRDPYTLGTYASRAPGQISRFGNLLAEPVDRLLFAGEHTARLQMGLEGAMESGERAALQVLERL